MVEVVEVEVVEVVVEVEVEVVEAALALTDRERARDQHGLHRLLLEILEGTCCGRHESFSHGRRCAPAGSHATGCVEAPLCTACFVCPCVRLIAARKAQEEDM